MLSDRPIRSEDDLLQVFHESEKPEAQWRIGAESEKIGLLRGNCSPLGYQHVEGKASVVALFAGLQAKYDFRPYRERADGPLLGLLRGKQSITLEPGAQVELSGEPWATVHEVAAELSAHFRDLRSVSDNLGIEWLGVGFQPLARLSELPWVPKERYPVMREYLPLGGSRAHDMMQRTATVQVNFDFSSEEDALRKTVISLRLSPIIQAMTANSPFIEGRVSGRKSERADVWLNMPKDRSGLIPALWREGKLGYRDYVGWALDAGMFLFKRGDRTFKNTGQTFRSFLADGFGGERASLSDWTLHLNTLFPEVRLKNTLEVRSCDAQGVELLSAVPALYTGILYDTQALAEADDIARTLTLEQVEQARPHLNTLGLAGELAGVPVRGLAQRVLEIALGGLQRRARVDASGSEAVYLAPLQALIERGQSPADTLTTGLAVGAEVPDKELLNRVRLFRDK